MRQARKAETCYEFVVQNLELDGAKRGQRAVPSPQRWDSSSLSDTTVRLPPEMTRRGKEAGVHLLLC